MIDLKDIITFTVFIGGIIGVLTKNENRISTIENKLTSALDNISKQIDELKQSKQDKALMKLELENIRQEITHVNNNIKQEMLHLYNNLDEIKDLLINKK